MVQWLALVNAVINKPSGSIKAEKFSTFCTTISFSREALLNVVSYPGNQMEPIKTMCGTPS
jgi:hypothetical protein